MYICYVDEAGCPGALPSPTSLVQPVLVLAGLIVPQANLSSLTAKFLRLKQRFNPGARPKSSHWLDSAKSEIKGSDLKRDIRMGNRNRRRAVFGFLDQVLELLAECDAHLTSRIYIKGPGQPFEGKRVYTAAVQALCTVLQRFLDDRDDQGLILADSRTPTLNSNVSHSIFTQKFRMGGDPYARVIEMPVFGHSENHVALQITDLLCSAILSPMATSAYCSGLITSCHVHPQDALIRQRYAERIKGLGFRYLEQGRWRGGVTINDAINHRPASLLFATH